MLQCDAPATHLDVAIGAPAGIKMSLSTPCVIPRPHWSVTGAVPQEQYRGAIAGSLFAVKTKKSSEEAAILRAAHGVDSYYDQTQDKARIAP